MKVKKKFKNHFLFWNLVGQIWRVFTLSYIRWTGHLGRYLVMMGRCYLPAIGFWRFALSCFSLSNWLEFIFLFGMHGIIMKRRAQCFLGEIFLIFWPEKCDFYTYKGFILKEMPPPLPLCQILFVFELPDFLQQVSTGSQNIKGFVIIFLFSYLFQ